MLEIIAVEKSLSLKKCFDAPHISDLNIPEKHLIKVVREVVLNTARMFKYSENMDLSQATLLAVDVLSHFKNESLEDIVLMFKMIRNGELGSGKGRLDNDTMFNIFAPAYLLKKSELWENQARREQKEKEKSDEPMTDYAFQKFDELSKKLSMNRIYDKQEKPVVNHHQIWLDKLKINVKNMSNSDIETELNKVKKLDQNIFGKAVEIYQNELNLRKNAG